jgi:hypothetical protein
MASRLTEPLFA